jgi:hypothetical protein
VQKWVIYDWGFAFVPICIVAFAFWIWHRNFQLSDIIGDGQLFFFCTALAASLFGDLSEVRDKLAAAQRDVAQLCEVGIIFIIVFTAAAFGVATQAPAADKPRIAEASLICSLVTSLFVFYARYQLGTW